VHRRRQNLGRISIDKKNDLPLKGSQACRLVGIGHSDEHLLSIFAVQTFSIGKYEAANKWIYSFGA
jgi:hypothetical protein